MLTYPTMNFQLTTSRSYNQRTLTAPCVSSPHDFGTAHRQRRLIHCGQCLIVYYKGAKPSVHLQFDRCDTMRRRLWCPQRTICRLRHTEKAAARARTPPIQTNQDVEAVANGMPVNMDVRKMRFTPNRCSFSRKATYEPWAGVSALKNFDETEITCQAEHYPSATMSNKTDDRGGSAIRRCRNHLHASGRSDASHLRLQATRSGGVETNKAMNPHPRT